MSTGLKKKSKKIGRPSSFTQEMAEKVCDRIAHSIKGLHFICQEEGMPGERTVEKWLEVNEDFRHQYARAKEKQADYIINEAIEIADETGNDTKVGSNGEIQADNEWIQRSKLRVDTRKWLASKLAPKKYGDKLDVTSAGEKIIQHVILEMPKPDGD